MQIDRISYQKVFPVSAYCTERIGLEASLDKDENPEIALQRLAILVNELHSATIATLEEYKGTKTVTVETTINTTIQAMIDDINNCTVVDEKNGLGVQVGLLAYEPITNQFPEIKEAYDNKLQSLQK